MQTENLKLFLNKSVKLIVREGSTVYVEPGTINEINEDTIVLDGPKGLKLISTDAVIKCELQNGGGGSV